MSSWVTIKRITILISLLVILPSLSYAGQFKVTRVYDGDTIKAEGSGIAIKVRLVGIDAPETAKKKRGARQPYSKRSKKHLARLILNKTIDIRSYGLDRYNRTLGVVFLNGKNINLEMVRSGMTEVYRGRSPKSLDLHTYRNAERKARAAKRGIWSLGDNHISPRKWRRGKRQSDSPPTDLPAYRYYISPREQERRERKSGLLPPYTPPYRQR